MIYDIIGTKVIDMKCDLHCHSIYSFDSTQSVDDILTRAKNANISVLAVCDHNEMAGSLEAQKQSEVEIIPGIEIDCFCEGKIIHLLGYGIDLTNPIYTELRDYYIQELERVSMIRLNKIQERYHCVLDIDKIKSLVAKGKPFTNVEITQVLLEDINHPELISYQTGELSKNPIANYYWDNLAISKWGYIEMKLPDYRDVIEWIHKTGGIVICAHPTITVGHDMAVIQKLIDHDMEGFEVYCSYHDSKEAKFYRDIVLKNNLLMTCGSDYHGTTKPNIHLGDTGYNDDCSQIVIALKESIMKNKNDKSCKIDFRVA